MELSDFFPFWGRLDANQQAMLVQSVRRRDIPAGTVLHNGQQDCEGLFAIISGQLRVYIASEAGRQVTLYRLLDDDICLFSASCMMPSIQFDVIVQAVQDTQAWMIPTPTYRQLMEQSAAVANYTNELIASRFTEVMWMIEQVMWNSFDRRLATFLLQQASIDGTDTLALTHETIANDMGTAREVVTRMLRYFSDEGLVELGRGTIIIKDRGGLQRLSS